MHQCSDGIGWIEKSDELIFICGYDGMIMSYLIKNIEQEKIIDSYR